MDNINNLQEKFIPCKYSEKLLNKLTKVNSQVTRPVDIKEITKAVYYAKKYHGSQMRQSGEPYYSHPVEVAYLFAEYTFIEIPKYFRTDLIVTSLLHDTIEDTDLTYDMISNIFGKIIANQVNDLTRIKTDKKISAAEMIDILFLQNKTDLLHIKLFDRLHNIRTIDNMPPEKINKIIDETINKFIFLSVNLNAINIEKELIKTCLKYLPKQQEIPHKFSYQADYRLPSLIL